MTENGIGSSGNPTVSTNGVSPASGYRVVLVGGALEVSARLSTAEELELLVKVLDANKVLWTGAAKSEAKVEAKAKPKIEFLDGPLAAPKAPRPALKAPIEADPPRSLQTENSFIDRKASNREQ